MRSDNDNETIA